MRLFILLLIIVSPLTNSTLFSQDIHLSHLHSGPILYNPAMTGLYNGDMRFIANYRNQWSSVGTDYRTCYGSAEIKTRRLFKSTSAVAFGLEVFSDGAGDLDYSQKGAQISVSGIKLMDGHNGRKLFSGGFKAGYVNNSFDATKIRAFDEELAIFKDGATSTGYFDMSAGLAWMHQLDNDKHSYYLGVSMSHINKPEISFDLAESDAVGNELFRRMVIHGGGDFTLKGKIAMQPSFLFMDQGPNREITAGTFFSYNNKPKSKRSRGNDFSLFLGAWVRGYYETDNVKGIDAVVMAAKSNFGNTSITFSYDMNVSSLALATTGRGGPEISYIQILNFRNAPNKRIQCPAFY